MEQMIEWVEKLQKNNIHLTFSGGDGFISINTNDVVEILENGSEVFEAKISGISVEELKNWKTYGAGRIMLCDWIEGERDE